MKKIVLTALLAGSFAFASVARADHNDSGHDHSGHAPDEHGAASSAPAKIVDAFAVGLASGNEKLVEKFLSPDVLIAESGGAERSLDEYRKAHLGADMAFIAGVKTTLLKRDEYLSGDIAVIVSENEMKGAYRAMPIHMRSMETMVLRKTEQGDWRIQHIHWSSKDMADSD